MVPVDRRVVFWTCFAARRVSGGHPRGRATLNCFGKSRRGLRRRLNNLDLGATFEPLFGKVRRRVLSHDPYRGRSAARPLSNEPTDVTGRGSEHRQHEGGTRGRFALDLLSPPPGSTVGPLSVKGGFEIQKNG